MPARIMLGALALTPEPAAMQIPRKAQSSANCTNRRTPSDGIRTRSRPAASSRVMVSTITNSGTDITRASVASPRAMIWAASTTRLPVICAVKRPSSPRKLVTSTLPATKARTNGSNIMPGELSTEGIDMPPCPHIVRAGASEFIAKPISQIVSTLAWLCRFADDRCERVVR